MKYLVDTHILLWTFFQPDKLGTKTLDLLQSQKDEKYISGINLWEIAIKYSLGKLELGKINPDQLENYILKAGFKILDVPHQIMNSYYRLPKKDNHKDPFDRLLIWQAIESDYILVTQDIKIEQYKDDGLKIFPAYTT